MSSKAQVKAQAKTAATPGPVHVGQHPMALPEREADRPDIATQLEGAVRLGHSLGAISVRSALPSQVQAGPLIQRQTPEEEEEEELQTKPADGVQRQGRGEGFRLDDETAGRINRARGGGQPLEGAVQARMGEAVGHDFNGVRVHTDAEADALNQQLSARAFTTGRDIFFRRSEYNPGSGPGRELIAHELSHVVQQKQGAVRPTREVAGIAVNDSPILEKEADTLAVEAAVNQRTSEESVDTSERVTPLADVAKPVGSVPSAVLQFSKGQLVNFATARMYKQVDKLAHELTWTSSTDDSRDLAHINTREHLSWQPAPEEFHPTEQFANAGTMDYGVKPADGGGATDRHDIYPYLGLRYSLPADGRSRDWSMDQQYQLQVDGGEWQDIPDQAFVIRRWFVQEGNTLTCYIRKTGDAQDFETQLEAPLG